MMFDRFDAQIWFAVGFRGQVQVLEKGHGSRHLEASGSSSYHGTAGTIAGVVVYIMLITPIAHFENVATSSDSPLHLFHCHRVF